MSDEDSVRSNSESKDVQSTGDSEKAELSEALSETTKGGEVTDPDDAPEGGYTFAPSPSNPGDGDGSGESDE